MASTEEGSEKIPSSPLFSGIKILYKEKTHSIPSARMCEQAAEFRAPGLAPIQGLAYPAKGSRWHLCTVSDFTLQVILGAALASSQGSVGASWHTPSGGNTEPAWADAVLWPRWWWNTVQFWSLLLCATSNDLLAGGSEGFAHSNLDLNWVFRVVLWRSVLALRSVLNSKAVLW